MLIRRLRIPPLLHCPLKHRHNRCHLDLSRRFNTIHNFTQPADDVDFRSYSPYGFVRALSSAADFSSLSTGASLHSCAFKLGLIASSVFVAAALLHLYKKCHRFIDVQSLFDEIPEPNVVAWNTLIYSHSQSPTPALAIESFVDMLSRGTRPTASTLSSVLVGCSRLEDPAVGTMLHCVCLKLGFCSNIVEGTMLVDVYSKCRNLVAARGVFDEMDERNAITWTSLITGYALDRRPTDAMLLVREMRRDGVGATKETFNSLLSSFWRFKDLSNGRQIHALVVKEGFEHDSYIAVTLVSMYSRCGSFEDFTRICLIVPNKDQIILCNSVIAGFLHLGDSKRVLERFSEMRRKCVDMDFFTFATSLRAIGILSAHEEGRQAHALIVKAGHASSLCIQNALVSMYAKCGEINNSKLVFSSMKDLDLISWNSILAGCAQHGYGREAVELFDDMRRIGVVTPNHTTFLSVLAACSHAGLVEEGLEIFYSIYGGQSPVVAEMEHYVCIVDLLGRAGYLDKAEAFVNNMPIKPDVPVYRALLSACQVYQNLEIAYRAARCLFELCPDDPSAHVLLANAFAADGCWDIAAGLRKNMRSKGVWKQLPAWSLIEDVVLS